MIVDIKVASMLANFEVIEIMDDNNPYPVILRIYWDTDMNGIININKRNMIFEKKLVRMIVPLDIVEGSCYTEPL